MENICSCRYDRRLHRVYMLSDSDSNYHLDCLPIPSPLLFRSVPRPSLVLFYCLDAHRLHLRPTSVLRLCLLDRNIDARSDNHSPPFLGKACGMMGLHLVRVH